MLVRLHVYESTKTSPESQKPSPLSFALLLVLQLYTLFFRPRYRAITISTTTLLLF
jgi:hypothetical protein